MLTVKPYRGIDQPVVDGTEIHDFAADWVADPFLQYDDGTYYLFAEAAKNEYPKNGACLVWYESPDGLSWKYQGVVLDRQPGSDMTDSYPQVIQHEGTRYLVPSFARGSNADEFRIYEFTDFPAELNHVETPVSEGVRGDPTLFNWQNKWYCIFEDFDHHLRLYYSDSFLDGNWVEHPESPIETSRELRPGGRPIVRSDCIDFFTQGPRSKRTSLLCYRITEISPERFEWTEIEASPVLYPASHSGRWNELKMHHIDTLEPPNDGKSIVSVDGQNRHGDYSIGIYRPSS
ncbi:hypothetical protein SAMN04488063_1661 [Halopelagius inordinatus]|uniref:Glucosamine inositolphosphorylceramide transferase 1 N-terminal domain-containing protein n=1 Tax=Halopelagius inordinatus TaxID=553467 RepID=A0A1I2PMY7_9EURY|nr:hypothetical protein [Halopelagius inordinatus]SFG17492.1 hypothetical protein SAMN04488063_1661 [Halopelagius inordinatus]